MHCIVVVGKMLCLLFLLPSYAYERNLQRIMFKMESETNVIKLQNVDRLVLC